MKTLGTTTVILGILACMVAIVIALDTEMREHINSGIAAAIAALGIVAAGAVFLHNSR
jgi:hypothetical protein